MQDTAPIADEHIAVLVQGGNKEQFGILMERYDKKLSRYGKKFLANRDNIDDIVQDVFISTYQNINSFDPKLKFSSWIYRIAHNAFVNELKKQQKRALPLPHFDLDIFVSHHRYADPVKEENEYKLMKAMIDKGIDELSPKYREVIILHYLEDFSYKEISDILRIPTGTVGIRIKRGKEALKKIYEKMNVEGLSNETYGTD